MYEPCATSLKLPSDWGSPGKPWRCGAAGVVEFGAGNIRSGRAAPTHVASAVDPLGARTVEKKNSGSDTPTRCPDADYFEWMTMFPPEIAVEGAASSCAPL
jgi:hypothetical protein